MDYLEGMYGERKMEKIARSVDIWRKPVADLESPSILNYVYNNANSWRIWPYSWNLKTFIDKHAERTLDSIASAYFQVKHTSDVSF